MRYQQHDGRDSTRTARTWLSILLLVAGIALRLWQYFGRSALWTDEATLANNIVARTYEQLFFAPLAHNQVAPVGFLLVEKLAVTSFGANELALRACPLIFSIVSLLLLWRVASRLLPTASVPLALAPFVFAPPLIFFAAEAKQYSSDIAIALALLLVALEINQREMTTRRIAGTAAAGALAVWFSQPAVLVVAGLGAALLIEATTTRERGRIAPTARIALAWALSALAATLFSLDHLTPESQRFMRVFWSDGFWPLSLQRPSSFTWPIVRIAFILGSQLGIPTSVGFACAILAVVGIAMTWRKERRTSLLLVMPLIATLGAAATRLYPFGDRLAVFEIPSLLLLAAIGVTELAALIRVKRFAALAIAGATIFLFAAEAQALHAAPPVYRREEITPAIAYLQRAGHSTDARYIYYGAVPAYEFYKSRDAGAAHAMLGSCHRGDTRGYLTELEKLRGRARVWILFAHELPRLHEQDTMLRYLDEIGSARDSMAAYGRDTNGKTTSVRLYLYDLSDSVRLGSAISRNFAIVDSVALDARFQCAPLVE
jgi:hypothetical protein